MQKKLCTVQYILVFTEFPDILVYWNQFSGRLSIDPGFTRLAGLSAVFVAEWRTGGLARRHYGGLAS